LFVSNVNWNRSSRQRFVVGNECGRGANARHAARDSTTDCANCAAGSAGAPRLVDANESEPATQSSPAKSHVSPESADDAIARANPSAGSGDSAGR